MEILVLLILILLAALWSSVKRLKEQNKEITETLQFQVKLLKDRLDILKKRLDKYEQTEPQSQPDKKTEKQSDEVADFSELSFSDEPVNKEESEKVIDEQKTGVTKEEEYEWLAESIKRKSAEKQAKQPDEPEAKHLDEQPEKVSKPAASAHKSPPTPPRPPENNQFDWSNFFSEIDWERFTGTQLFAWLGGLALFVGAGFFVKYSIDNNLISPIMRLVVAAIIGVGLIGASFVFDRKRYNILRQTFSAGGIGVLYSVFFAATLYYEYLAKMPGFAALVVVSVAALSLALFHRGVSIAFLGALGAYLTPLLVNTGQGNILTLFIYLVIVNLGLYQVIKRLKSGGLLLFSSLGTMVTLALVAMFSRPSPITSHIAITFAAHLALYSIYFLKLEFNYSTNRLAAWAVRLSTFAMPFAAFVLAIYRTGPSPLLLIVATVAALVVLAYRIRFFFEDVIPLSVFAFLVTACWVFFRLNPQISSWAYLLFFAYGIAGGLGPVLLVHKYGLNQQILKWFKIFPSALALLSLMALLINPDTAFLFWPMTIGIQLMGIALSLVFSAFAPLFVLTLILVFSAIIFISKASVITFGLAFYAFILMAGLAICIVTFIFLRNAAAIAQKLNFETPIKENKNNLSAINEWAAASPIMGMFFILAAAFFKSQPLNPNPGMVTMFCFLVIAQTLARRLNYGYLGIASLLSAVLAQAFWVLRPDLLLSHHFTALLWSIAFFVIALIIPFVAFKNFEKYKKSWMGWPVFELLQAVFIVYAADHIWARSISGLIPLILALVKIPVVLILLRQLEKNTARNSILAFHGGAMLFYVSAVPALMLEAGWLGLVFVFEATALLWLNRRIEHPGLRYVASVLSPIGIYLIISYFPQLKEAGGIKVLNPVVLSALAGSISCVLAVKLAGYPDEKPCSWFNIVKYFKWIAFGFTFYFFNVLAVDIFSDVKHNVSLAKTGVWFVYGLMMHKWPKKLDNSYRLAGLILIFIGILASVLFPFRYAAEFGKMAPLFNQVSALYLLITFITLWLLGRKKVAEEWPLYSINEIPFWSVTLALLSFAYLNIEIASFFGSKGSSFSLLTHGRFAQQLSYSLGWLFYAIALLGAGIRWNAVRARQAALVLIIVTSVKIFLKDLWSLGQLYRVASFIGLAVILMLVSYLYQRFLSNMKEK
ncbi:MAG: DUF2339 domain-containing protein [Candidatus Rifleibacteriota bacterium]